AVSFLECLYYRYSDRAIYLRLDFSTPFLATHTEFEVRVSVNSKSHFRLHAKARAGKVASMEARRDEVKLEVPPGEHSGFAAAFERIFEVRLDFATVGLASGEETLLQVALWMNKLKLCSGRASAVAAALALGLFLAARARAGEPELKFEISFPAAVHSNPITGRIFVVVSMSGEREPRLQVGSWGDAPPLFGAD